jgi:type VI secretion system secreted protein VgrG
MIQSTGPIFYGGPHATDLVVRAMSFSEELSTPFTYNLEVASDKKDLDPKKFLGEPVTVKVAIEGGEPRFFSGWVSEFYMLGAIFENTVYRMVLRPWLAFLQNSADCQIYMNKTVPDIIAEVFRRAGISDFDPQLSGDYQPPREYTVQYRESDFNFVSRLMEAEGIYYYFRHLDGLHELVMCDTIVQHEPVEKYEEILFLPKGDRRRFQVEYIHNWQSRHRTVTGGVQLLDFDFNDPGAGNFMALDVIDPEPHARGDSIVFDYPGGYTSATLETQGRSIIKRRLEELKTPHLGAMGESNARGLTVGHSFKLKGHPIDAMNVDYLITSMQGTIASHSLESAASLDQGELFRCQFTCVPTSRTFRPARRTPCPVIHGVQTAIVVGKAGKEIHTDELGRVKLKFPWFRFGTNEEGEFSRWVRVSQLWAGQDWGAMHIPRIGQEVIVQFLEGDPDQPIVVGRVYNRDHMPPYALDKNATQSGIKSRSTPGGGLNNFNEIRFEDKKGEEDLFIHAENTQTTSVKGNQSISVGGKRDVTVTKQDTENYDGQREVNVKTLDKNVVTGKKEAKVSGMYAITADQEFLATSGETMLDMHDAYIKLDNIASKLIIDAGAATFDGQDSVELKSGFNTVTIKKSGEIEVKATSKVSIEGATEVTLKSDVTVKISAPVVEIVGDTMIKLNS